MKLSSVTSSAGFTLPHPRYQYASIRVDLSATAELEAGEAPAAAVRKLNIWLAKEARRRVSELIAEEQQDPTGHWASNTKGVDANG